MLQIEGREDAAPDVRRVVTLDDILPPVVQLAIAEQESDAAERQILLVIPRNSIGNKCQSGTIQFSLPLRSLPASADLHRLVHFRVGVRFMLPFIPSPSRKEAEPIGERLFDIHAKSILDGGLQRVRGDLRGRGVSPAKKLATATL